MMAAVQVNSHLDLRVNMFNLTDEYYFDRLGGGHLIPGPARAASITTNVRVSSRQEGGKRRRCCYRFPMF
jgi:outer membrane receptor for monomeric catechols